MKCGNPVRVFCFIRVNILIRGLEIQVCVIQHFCVKFTTSNELSYNGNYYFEAKKPNTCGFDKLWRQLCSQLQAKTGRLCL
jgi:hypothetical protein